MMKICLVNVSDVDEAMRSRLRVWRNSEKAQPFRIFFNRTFCHTCLRNLCKIIQMQTFREGYSQKNL